MDHKTQAIDRVMRLAARDPFVNACGIRCVDAGPGHATVALDIGATHINFNGACHGGAIFTLADAAFGLASNSHGMIAVGIDAHITYHVAAQLGDELTATATEVSRTRRIAVYRIDVTRADGTLIAGFTGTVYVLARSNESAHGLGEPAAPAGAGKEDGRAARRQRPLNFGARLPRNAAMPSCRSSVAHR